MNTIMRIVEISDYTIVVMKDSDDPPWLSISRYAEWKDRNIMLYHAEVTSPIDQVDDCVISKEYICTGGKLIMYFADALPDNFKKGDKVLISMTRLSNKEQLRRYT